MCLKTPNLRGFQKKIRDNKKWYEGAERDAIKGKYDKYLLKDKQIDIPKEGVLFDPETKTLTSFIDEEKVVRQYPNGVVSVYDTNKHIENVFDKKSEYVFDPNGLIYKYTKNKATLKHKKVIAATGIIGAGGIATGIYFLNKSLATNSTSEIKFNGSELYNSIS